MTQLDQIEARAKIVEVLSHGGFCAELANGHICVARPAAKGPADFAMGDEVRLAFHPADLSRARIIGKF